MTDIARPVGLVPGTRDFFHEVTASRARIVLDQIVQAMTPENISPSSMRALALVLERTDPTVSSVHHTIETKTTKLSTEELKAKLAEILGRNMGREAETVECFDIVESPEVYADIVNEVIEGTDGD